MIRATITLFLLTLSALAAAAQQPAKASPAPNKPVLSSAEAPSTTEHLNDAEKLSLQYIQEQQQRLQSEFIAWEESVRRSHPGFHLDRTHPMDGLLYPDVKAPDSKK